MSIPVDAPGGCKGMTRGKKLLFSLGMLGIADTMLMLVIAGGMNAGTLLPGIAGFVLVAWSVYTGGSPLSFTRLHRWSIQTVAFFVLLLGAVSFAAVQVLILAHAFEEDTGEAEWCIVLGAGLRGDSPSLTLQRRIAVACAYLEKHPLARVVVSGGQGRNETITEAEGMRRALIKQGVAAERIYLEDRASSTLENLRYSRDIILATGGNTDRGVAVVTSNFHLLRVRLLAKRVGMRVRCVPAPTPWYLLPNVCLREYFALIKSLLADW